MPEPAEHESSSHQDNEQRFRSSLITSVSAHVLLTAVVLLGPLLVPTARPIPEFTPVHVVTLPAAAAPPEPQPAAEPAEEEEVEPVAPVVSEPEPIPRSLADLQREQEEERQRQEELERERERQRQRELERQRRERQLEEQRREEERRRAPQSAGRRPTPQTQEARRQGIDLTSGQGETGYTVEEFPFSDYLFQLRNLIADRWNPPPRGPYSTELRVEVFFRLGRDGRLVVQPRVLGASGESLFDQAALRAIASAAPFPPLPRQYEGQSLGVGLAFVQE